MKRVASILSMAIATTAFAQVKPEDTPKFNIGALIFGDYTYVQSPQSKDADGNTIHLSSFNVSRAYINLTGNLNHWIGFRITPDVARETSSSSTLSGSQEFRLKYAYGQFNLDDWTTKGSWIRFGVTQTPYLDYLESIERYRFQGPMFAEREGYLTASDAGVSARYVFPRDYGDVHAGFYNGEGFSKAETNNEKAFQIRTSLRPLPLGGIWKGLRITGFYDADHYVENAKRTRVIAQLTFESPHFNGGVDAINAKDRTSISKPEVEGRGWSVWLNPRMRHGLELLIRHDHHTPDSSTSSQKHKRDIVGVAYWFQNLQRVTSALLLDYDSLKLPGFGRPNETRYGLKMLINF